MVPSERDDADTDERAPASLASARTVLDTQKSAVDPPPPSLASARTALAPATESASGPRPVSSGLTLRPFGPYSQVLALEAQGSMGWVARGFNEGFGRWELLKFLRPELAGEVELIRQFTREGRVLAKLSHPNVVQVFAMYSLDGMPCLAMEYLEGKSLGELVTEAGGTLTSAQALELMIDAARGLSAAHELGLLHRDLKPDNLFVVAGSRGRARALKLIDFGLATADRARPEALLNDPSLDSNAVGGTPLFLAPELWKGQPASPRSDLYALGISFYHALTGAYPSGPIGIRGLMEYAKSPDPAPRLRDARADALPGLAGLIDRLISKKPGERPESAAALLHELVALGEASRPRQVPGAGPFRGLLPYAEGERDVFFGRDGEIAELTERLRADYGVALVGAPACGKTSLVQAGVVPLVKSGILGGGLRYVAAIVEPSRRPLAALAAALSSVLGISEDELRTACDEGADRAVDVVRRRLAGATGLLLVVDQLERLPRLAEHSAEAARFAQIVARLADNHAAEIKVLCCLRSDALDELVTLGELKSFFARGFVPLSALSVDALREASERALAVAGYSCDDPPALHALIGELAPLRYGALLSNLALASLWRERDEPKRVIEFAPFLAAGGFASVLVRHADAVVESVSEKQRLLAADILARFVSADRHAQRVQQGELLAWQAAAETPLALLVESRLLIEVGDELELVHPLLVERWGFLRTAIESSGDDRVLRERVAAAARDWDAQGRPEGALWHGEQGDRLVAWFLSTESRFGELELEFIAAVRRQGRRRKVLRRVGTGLAIGLMTIVASWAVIGRRQLQAELGRERQASATATKASKEKIRRAELRLAELELEHDPLAALAAAQRSRALGDDPRLDVIGWAARLRGVPLGLPLHPGGAGGVRVTADGRHVVTWGGEALHVLEISGEERQSLALELPPTAVVELGGGPAPKLALGNIRGEVFLREASQPTLRKLGTCAGAVRRLLAHGESVRLLCARPDQPQIGAYDLPLSGGEPRSLWSGAARAAEFDASGKQIAAVSERSLRIWSEDGKSAELELGDRPSAIAWLGSAVVLGMERGELALARREGEKLLLDKSLTSRKSAVRKIVSAPGGTHAVAFFDDGGALLVTSALERISELESRSRQALFIDDYSAVVLAGASQRLLVLSTIDGKKLGDLGPISGELSGLDGNAEWLFASSLDGSTRAFTLYTSLPRRRASPLDGGARGRCALALDGNGVACVSETRLFMVPLSGKLPTRSVELGAGVQPGADALLAVSPGGGQVAWVSSAGHLVSWNGERALEDESSSAIEWLSATPEVGVWLSAERRNEKRVLRISGRRGAAPEPVVASFEPKLVAFAADGRTLLLDAQGALHEAHAVEGPYERGVSLEPTQKLTAMTFSAGADRLIVGTAQGRVGLLDVTSGKLSFVGTLPGAISAVAALREDRALIAADVRGNVALVDLETASQLVVFGSAGSAISAALYPASGWVGFSTPRGDAWRLALDTTPLGFSAAPEDPLDPKTRPFTSWRGLGAHE